MGGDKSERLHVFYYFMYAKFYFLTLDEVFLKKSATYNKFKVGILKNKLHVGLFRLLFI